MAPSNIPDSRNGAHPRSHFRRSAGAKIVPSSMPGILNIQSTSNRRAKAGSRAMASLTIFVVRSTIFC